jgi:circadian clock protein KaiC
LPGYSLDADQLANLLAEDIERRGVRRLVIDSATELDLAIGDPTRKLRFLSALVSFLRSRNVTTYTTLDLATIMGPEVDLAGTPLSIIAENLLLLRTVEYRSQLHRICSVLKMRFSEYDRAIAEYSVVAGQGIRIVGPAPLGQGLLTGIASPLLDIPQLDQRRDPATHPAGDRPESR